MSDLLDAADRLERGELRILLTIGNPDEGPFTREDKVVAEVLEQVAIFLRRIAVTGPAEREKGCMGSYINVFTGEDQGYRRKPAGRRCEGRALDDNGVTMRRCTGMAGHSGPCGGVHPSQNPGAPLSEWERIAELLSDFATTIEGEALPGEVAAFADRILATRNR